MAVLVEHEKRKREILDKALDLFIEEGYEDVTYQKIADRCGITRTTLYIYFKNKREIFLFSIKQLIGSLEEQLKQIISDESANAIDVLKQMINRTLDECESNRQLFKVILLYLIQIQKSGEDPDEHVNRRVIRMQHLMSTVVIRGQKNGDIKKDLPVKEINDVLYSLLESAIFRLAALNQDNLNASRQLINFTIDQFKA